MGFLDRIFGKNPDPDAPFMEHPTGDFDSATAAMADAIQRLRKLPDWNDWITFCAQGAGADEDSDYMADIRMRRDIIHVEKPIDIPVIISRAGVAATALTRVEEGYSIAGASPLEAAKILDAIFRETLGIRPHVDEVDDYAVGAEW